MHFTGDSDEQELTCQKLLVSRHYALVVSDGLRLNQTNASLPCLCVCVCVGMFEVLALTKVSSWALRVVGVPSVGSL